MRVVKSGRAEGLPYSLSRWTDVPHAKWAWMMEQFHQGKMIAFDQRTAVPAEWSLRPEDTLGLVWWTKNPTNLIREYARLREYNNQIHMTLTGWEEVEPGAPTLREGMHLLDRVAPLYGMDRVFWRFSPVPDVPDVVSRFKQIAQVAAGVGLQEVYLSFLQTNDRLPETRTPEQRITLMRQMAEVADTLGLHVRLCNEDRVLMGVENLPVNLGSGVCVRPESFAIPGQDRPPSEGCGCVLAVDPFTINETCTMGCQYCYAADQSLSPKKRNTTKRYLPLLP